MQIEEGVMAIVYDSLQDLYNSSNHMKDNIPNIPKNSSCYIYIAFCDFCYKSSTVKILIKIKKNHSLKVLTKSLFQCPFLKKLLFRDMLFEMIHESKTELLGKL